MLLSILGKWSSTLYDVPLITRVVEKEMHHKAEDEDLKNALMILYDRSYRHDETLQILLSDRSTRVFEYIEHHEFFEAIRSKESLEVLYEIDEKQTTLLLARAPAKLLPSRAVVPILEELNDRKKLFNYLHTLFNVNPDEVNAYHKKLLELYCEFDSSGGLLRFLR